MSIYCDRAPAGWYCTRPHGHDGPCAVHPVICPAPTDVGMAWLYTAPPAAQNEPVAWTHPTSLERLAAHRAGNADGYGYVYAFASPGNRVDVPLYTAPPAAQAVPDGEEYAGFPIKKQIRLAKLNLLSELQYAVKNMPPKIQRPIWVSNHKNEFFIAGIEALLTMVLAEIELSMDPLFAEGKAEREAIKGQGEGR